MPLGHNASGYVVQAGYRYALLFKCDILWAMLNSSEFTLNR